MATASPELRVQSSSSSESEFEGSCNPGHLYMSNLHIDTTEADVRNFFQDIGEIDWVHIPNGDFDDGFDGRMKRGVVRFNSQSHAIVKAAMNLKGDSLLGSPVFLAPHANDREIYFISGFSKKLSEDAIKERLKNLFNSCGTISNFFFPKDRDTDSYLGFCYIILEVPDEATTNVAAMSKTLMEDFDIHVRPRSTQAVFFLYRWQTLAR